MTRADSGRVTLRDVADHAGCRRRRCRLCCRAVATCAFRQPPRNASCSPRGCSVIAAAWCRAPRPSPVRPLTGWSPTPSAVSRFAGEMIRGCIAAADEHGHTVLMAESQGDPHLESAAIDSMLEHGVDRIRYGTTGGKKVHLPRPLRGRAVVLMNCLDEASPLPAVLPDEYEAGRLVADTLLSVGHSDRIWLVGETPRESWAGRRRLAGTRARLRSAGLTIARHVECVWWPEVARNAVLDALRDQPMAAAIVALNDRVAMDI